MRVSTAVIILSLAASVAPAVALPLPALKYASPLLHLRFSTYILLCRSRGGSVSTFWRPPPQPPLLPQYRPTEHGLTQMPELQHPRPTKPYPPQFVYQPLTPPIRPSTDLDHTPSSTSHAPPSTYHTPPSTYNTPPSTYNTPPSTYNTPPDKSPSRYQSRSPLSLERELLERVDRRIKLAARAYVRELLTAPMNDLD